MKKAIFKSLTAGLTMIFWLSANMLLAQKSNPAKLEIVSVKSLPFLQEKNGIFLQPVIVRVTFSGDSCKALVTAEGNLPVTFSIKKGENSLEVPLIAAESEKNVTLKIESRGIPSVQTQVTLKPVKKLVCYILPHSHTDIGYTEIQTAIEDKQVQNLVKGMDLAKKTAHYPEGARFVWNVEVAWAADLFLNRMNDAQKKDFLEAVTSGQVALNGMYLNVLTGLCRPEELTRLFKFSTELSRICKVPVNAAMTSDIPGQTWGTVTAMSQAGIRYFSTAPNFFDRIGDILVKWENKPFYWSSPSGKEKVLVWIPLKGYALSHMIKKLSDGFVSDFVHQLDSTGYPYDIAHLRWSGHGDNAEPDPEICEFVKDFNTRYAWPKFIIASTSQAFEVFEKRYGNNLPVVSGDWTPYWEDGAGSSALETAMNRQSSDRLSQAEALWAMHSPETYPVKEFEEAWKKVLLYSEHTWGAWCSLTDPENKMTHEQWEIKRSYALDAKKQSEQLLAKAVMLGWKETKGSAIEIMNTNSWSRTDVVLIPAALSTAGDKVTGNDKKPVPSQRLVTGELAVLVKDIPPFSSRRYFISKGKAFVEGNASVTGNMLTNGIVSVTIDPQTGAISKLISTVIPGKNLVNSGSGYGLNDYAFLESDKINDIRKAFNVRISPKENGPLVASLFIESEAPACKKLIREVRIVACREHIELINLVDKKRAAITDKPGDWSIAQKGNKESVNFAFSFNLPQGVVRLDVPYGVMQPEKDQIPSACKNWLTANRWADVSDGEKGIALITLDAPLFEVGGITATMLGSQTNPNVWRKHIDPTQTLFSWVMNNHWGTNYRAYQEGPVTFRYILWPHGNFNAGKNSELAIGYSQPLIVKPASAETLVSGGITPENPAVIVTAIKPADDGKDIMLVLFNSSASDITTRLKSAKNIRNIYLSNTAEDKLETVSGELAIPAWGTLMLRIEQ